MKLQEEGLATGIPLSLVKTFVVLLHKYPN